MSRFSIKLKDEVEVTCGREKGKRGKVTRVLTSLGQVVVEKTNMVKRHVRPSKKYAHGGIIEKEAPIDISNVMLVCPKCHKPTRVGRRFLDDGTKVRFCKKCGEVIDK